MSKTTQQQPVELDEAALDQSVGGALAGQRSRVTSITVTFNTPASNTGDPDQPLVLGNIPNADR